MLEMISDKYRKAIKESMLFQMVRQTGWRYENCSELIIFIVFNNFLEISVQSLTV